MSKWIVPGYTELKELGAGGFGSVVLARHGATGTPVAIKYLLPNLREDPDFAAMFRAEAESLGTLNDPNVVRLYEYVESLAGAAIIMELVDGVTLGNILKQYGKTSPEAALVILYGSLLGLAAAHARGVVHRDYKPANVLVNANGASKLTDFGIAARAGTPTIPSGSVAYAPPEQFDGGPASPASDVYAATATFYECLAGRPPFTGTTMYAVIEQHRTADVPMDPIPEPLQPIIARGMAKDPRYRPADAAALATELRTTAASTYGPNWEHYGRSQLGEATLLLALLWPSAGLPALQGTTVAQAHLTQAAQHAHTAQAAHHSMSKAALHRWHVRHVLHVKHLRAVTLTATASAVVAAGVTVAATSQPPSGPGTAAQPAAATYQVSPAPVVPAGTVPLYLQGDQDAIGRQVFVAYGAAQARAGSPTSASVGGAVPNAVPGEVARLYAQPFPYTSPPAPVQTSPLKPAAGGSASFQFTVSPTVATRYHAELLRNATATTPLAATKTQTLYVIGAYKLREAGLAHCASVVAPTTCTEQVTVTAYFPPAVIDSEMTMPRHLYLSMVSSGNLEPPMRLNPTASLTAPQRVADDAYQMTATFTWAVAAAGGSFTVFAFCTVLAEASDGVGLSNEAACGQESISEAATAVWGSAVPLIAGPYGGAKPLTGT